MLTALTTGVRFRLAIALTTFAALCFVAPPAVLAFGHGENTAQCLSHADAVNHGTAKAHHMEHQASHSPSVGAAPADDDHQMSCCGLFCLSALAVDAGTAIDLGGAHSFFPTLASSLFSRSPERLDRPPISLLSV
ncbi:MAG TPA: hypothetical protein VFD26_00605 [Methyloceanibacter sp.]|nr:hypothetical protein [Methyloceanibacter sp.]